MNKTELFWGGFDPSGFGFRKLIEIETISKREKYKIQKILCIVGMIIASIIMFLPLYKPIGLSWGNFLIIGGVIFLPFAKMQGYYKNKEEIHKKDMEKFISVIDAEIRKRDMIILSEKQAIPDGK